MSEEWGTNFFNQLREKTNGEINRSDGGARIWSVAAGATLCTQHDKIEKRMRPENRTKTEGAEKSD